MILSSVRRYARSNSGPFPEAALPGWFAFLLACISSVAPQELLARPYPGITGLVATADSAATAGTNPAGITRLGERSFEVELMWFSSESTWESSSSLTGQLGKSKNAGDTLVPRVFYVEPISESLAFSFTVTGVGFSDDYGDWPGRYFIESYDSVYATALPSLAYRINEQWSVAGSAAITYSKFDQERRVANIFDPGFGEGRSKLETDSIEFGFGVSALYEASDRTRWGLAYNSEIDASRDGESDFSGLGPRTEAVMQRLGIIGANIEVQGTSPQSLLLGLYHEFLNDHAVTLDVAWVDFSNFRLSEYYFNGEAFAESDVDYDDAYAAAVSYTWPVSDRWMLGVGGLVTSQLVDDDERTMLLRLDAVWSAGVAAEWRWTDTRRVTASLSYLSFGDAPVTTEPIPGVGSIKGEFTSRDTVLLQVGISWGGGG